MLYIFDKIDTLAEGFPERCSYHLSEQRREKVLSYRFSLDRNLSAAAYLLLRLALKDNYGIDEPVVFSFGKNGKPFLRDYPRICFNLSHCRKAVACAVSLCDVGVDVQEIAPVSDDLARRVLTANEYETFKTAENPFQRFCEYWVIKESYLKKTGDGIGAELSMLAAEDVRYKTLLVNGNGYCCCAADNSGRILAVNMIASTACLNPQVYGELL